jgi:hypothetical protein
MPGCCLPSLTAATALHFTAGYLKNFHSNNNGHRVLPFSAAIALCPLEAQERSACREKNTPTPQIADLVLCLWWIIEYPEAGIKHLQLMSRTAVHKHLQKIVGRAPLGA